MAVLEARPYRPFKSSEEYLEAMKEDLAEWLSTLYPDLLINAENFMDRLDTGVALCKHANFVREAAEDYLARRQARNKSMTRSMTSGLAGPILAMGTVHYLPAAKSGTFFARDNVSNFITWCRKSLKIIECLLFETDDLIMRKNEKHVILCLLEVARRGAKFGMLAPMLVQMERQIDREIAAEQKANATQTTDNSATQTSEIGVGTDNAATETDMFDSDSDSENDNDVDDDPVLMYGPQPQIITNDLKSLDEMVRDLVEKCTCPSQFPMVRVSEGKYRIGDTKVLIFVRILRSHVMVRVGGGWDTLSHYLDKHDPCRCKAQHRASVGARVIPRSSNQSNGIELHKAQVIYERSPPPVRKFLSNVSNQSAANQQQQQQTLTPSTAAFNNNSLNASPSGYAAGPGGSRSPTPQRKFLNHLNGSGGGDSGGGDKLQPPASAATTNGIGNLFTSPNLARRSMSPSPKRLIDMRKKHNSLESYKSGGGLAADIDNGPEALSQNGGGSAGSGGGGSDSSANNSNKFENISDNGSEISDEGYRSLGVIQLNAQKRESLHSQASNEDAESNARLDHTSSESPLSPIDDATLSSKTPEVGDMLDAGPQSLPAIISAASPTLMLGNTLANNKFEQSGVYITDDEITVDISSALPLKESRIQAPRAGKTPTGERKAGSVNALQQPERSSTRRRSIDNSTCGGSLQDLNSRTGLPVFSRSKPVYRSVRKPVEPPVVANGGAGRKSNIPAVRDVTNTWSGRSVAVTGRKRPTISAETFQPSRPASMSPNTTAASPFERNIRQRSTQILYDSNGRRIKGCTASLTTSPVKSYATSPLAQQLLEAANSAKNDAQILERMKTLLSRYSSGNQQAGKTPPGGKKPAYDDFTTAWVHSNGNLERSNSCSPPTKTLSKRSSAASSIESNASRDMSSVLVAPRRERGMSKIPAPVRQNTELY